MNYRIFSGLTTATLLVMTFGTTPMGVASPSAQGSDAQSSGKVATGAKVAAGNGQGQSNAPGQVLGVPVPTQSESGTAIATQQSLQLADRRIEARPPASATANAINVSPSPAQNTSEAVKVGVSQTQERIDAQNAIAVIYPHSVSGQQAATVYVRNIPVLTVVGGAAAESSTPSNRPIASSGSNTAKVGATQAATQTTNGTAARTASGSAAVALQSAQTNLSPAVQRATAIAAQLNDLSRQGVAGSSVIGAWDTQSEQYVIRSGSTELIRMDEGVVVPEPTRDRGEDTLQAVNLIRRQMGNADPVREIEGAPRPAATRVAVGNVEFTISGLASWYGPGFHGNLSASGEVFDQNDMTAAHKELPFGTQVRVTNMDNGLSVVVRINDRGPYSGDRIIDLSAAAADAIGLTNSGFAPVTVEILGAAAN
jgi:rare lipoprotein A